MTRLGARGRVFVVSFGLVLVILVATESWLERSLRRLLETRVEAELQHAAGMGRVAVERAPAAEIDAVADALGAASEARITVVGPDGRVLGDSSVPAAALATVDNHGERPEIVAARAGGIGVTRRYSGTTHEDMVYVALPCDTPDGPGFVRAAVSLAALDALLGRVRLFVWVGVLFGLVLAVVGSAASAELLSRSLRDLVVSARALAAGGARRVPVKGEAEIVGLAGSFNRLADELDAAVGALARERDRLGVVLEGMSEGVLALDRDGRVVLANRAAGDLLGGAPDLDRPLSSDLLAPVVQAALRGAAADREIDLPGGRHLLARATPTADGCVVVMLDVTELRRLERVRRDFVANVSHELRTPVSVIMGHAETLADGGLDDLAHRDTFVSAIVRNAHRLTRLISDLLDLSRIEAGRYPIDPGPCELREVADAAVTALRGRARARGQAVGVEIPAGLEAVADEMALEHVLTNLLENAVKYTPEGGHVTVRATPSGDRVRIEVADDGPGIPEQHRGRLFERFYRVDPGRDRAVGGTGLGLAIVRHLVEAMDGRVGMEPNHPTGSVFWVELPAISSPSGATSATG